MVTAPPAVESALAPAGAIKEIADLARRDAGRVPEAFKVDHESKLVLVKLRHDEKLETLDLERYLVTPSRARGDAVLHDPSDFAEYVNRLASEVYTTVWADVRAGSVTAVINDHPAWDSAGWRDHTVQLQLQPDPDWVKWHGRDGKLASQVDFAEFVEDVSHTIVEPDAATMLEVATTMSAKRYVDFSQATRLATGDVQLTCVETTQAAAGAKSNVEIPAVIKVRIAPWLGVETVDLDARLRWRIRENQLTIGYQLLRSDIAKRDAFAQLVAKISELLDDTLTVYLGAPPGPVRRA